MRTLRVLAVIDTLGAGGTERQLATLAPAFLAAGVDLVVVSLFQPPADRPLSVITDLRAAGAQVHGLDLPHRWRFDLAVPKLLRLVREHQPHVLHGRLFYAQLLTGFVGHLINALPTVISFHNLAWEYPALPARTQLRRIVERRLYSPRVDAFAAVSEAVAESYRRHLRLREVRVIRNTIPAFDGSRRDSWRPREAVRSSLDVAEDDLLVVTPARLEPMKGHTYLLRAAVALRESHPRIKFVFLGGGPLGEALRQEAHDLGVAKMFRIDNRQVLHEEVLQTLNAADICVLPSRFEGFPNAAAEAMAIGVPLVSTDIGGVRAVVGQSGAAVLVPRDNAPALARALSELADDPARRRELGARGRRYVEEEFSVARTVSQWVELYRSAAHRAEERARS